MPKDTGRKKRTTSQSKLFPVDACQDRPDQPCYICKTDRWMQRCDGSWICSTCHPRPVNQEFFEMAALHSLVCRLDDLEMRVTGLEIIQDTLSYSETQYDWLDEEIASEKRILIRTQAA